MFRDTRDLPQLLAVLPAPIAEELRERDCDELIEIVMDLGRAPELRFLGGSESLDMTIDRGHIGETLQKIGEFGADNRAGIEKTLHRISAIRNRQGKVIGLTCRVGRVVVGTINLIEDLVESGESILLLGRPGVGKTTALREIAKYLADQRRVVIVDTSNEIAGDGDIPHPAIGRARRMPVAHPDLQHKVMIEAVENHTPEVIVIDEIGTELEALAARTIAERGVQLIGTAHGNYLDNLMKNPDLNHLVGGIQSVTLGDEEARRRGSQKTVLEREAPPTFTKAVEMIDRYSWAVYQDVAGAVDCLLGGRAPGKEVRTSEGGRVTTQTIEPEAKTMPSAGGVRVYFYGIPIKIVHQIAALDETVQVVHKVGDAEAAVISSANKKGSAELRRAAENRGIPYIEARQTSLDSVRSALTALVGLR